MMAPGKNFGRFLITWRGLLLLVPLVVLFLKLSKIKKRQTVMTTTDKSEATKVLTYLIAFGVKPQQARFITAQAGHETGNFTSAIYKENNNCFGMKFPRLRKTMATGINKGHAVFNSLHDCIKDFLLYYRFVSLLEVYSSIEEYVSALKKRNYFEADLNEYVRGCKLFYKKYFET